MAYGAVAPVAGRARGTHRRESDFGEVVVRPTEPNHHKRPVVFHQVLTRMDPVYQEREIDALRRLRAIGDYRRRGASRNIRVGWIVAHDAVFRLIAKPPVQRERNVALVALRGCDHLAALLDR